MTNQDNKVAGAAYIINFASIVKSLNEALSIYVCVCVELDRRYGTNTDKMLPQEIDILKSKSLEIRRCANLAYVNIEALAMPTKQDISAIKKNYKNLPKDIIIEPTTYESFIIEINKFLVDNTVSKLFDTSEDFIKGVYDNGGV